MDDNNKTKTQLIEELKALRQKLKSHNKFVDTSIDSTINKQAKESPFKQCGWLFNILKSFPGAIYQLKMDADGTFSMPYLSAGAEKIFGHPMDVLTNIPVSFNNVHKEDREMFLQSIEESAKNFTNWLCEYQIITSAGDVKWIHGESIPNRMTDGGIEWNGVLIDVTEKKNAEYEKERAYELLDNIRKSYSVYLSTDDPQATFQSLLHTLIVMTDSEFGFLDEVLLDERGELYKLNLALSDISWDQNSLELYQKLINKNFEFRNLDNLSGLPAKTGKLVISNDAKNDKLSRGIPNGHPKLTTFMGIPLYFGGELVGVAGIANRKNGYNKAMVEWLEPYFIIMCKHHQF